MNCKSLSFIALFPLALASIPCLAAGNYKPLAQDCDGFTQLPVVTPSDMCVGLVAQRDASHPFKMPRTLIQTPDDKLLVVDMGGWVKGKGVLWQLDYRSPDAPAKALLRQLDLPHKILVGPKGKIYLGEATRLTRYQWIKGELVNREIILDNLPMNEKYLHPLKNFAFDAQGNLLLNIGSSSDRCNKKVPLEQCLDGTEASIRRYAYDANTDTYSSEFTLLGRGLRNSMALAVHASGTVLQAENSYDFPDEKEPYEEVNIVAAGKFYGWPLCYNHNQPLGKGGCQGKDYQPPWTLVPPHVSPLDMLYYSHAKLPALNNRLIMGWHGYRPAGSRLVSYEVDSQGRPVLQKQAFFRATPPSPAGDYVKHPFAPKGGLGGQVAQHQEVISEWHEIPGLRPKGAPVGLTQARDGSLFIVEDRNAAILRLSTGKAYQAQPVVDIPAAPAVMPPKPVMDLVRSRCAQCHNELVNAPDRVFNENAWLKKTEGQTLMAQRVFFDQLRPMPASGSLTEPERLALKGWLDGL